MKHFYFFILALISVSVSTFAQNGHKDTTSQLAEVVVDGKRSLNKKAITIGKLPVASIDLPQSVTVINQEVLRDQQAQRLSDVVKNINGVYISTTRGSTQEAFFARGYSFSSFNMFKNGSRVNSGVMPEMSSLERVEVLKGSAAILYGNVAPGGILNMVSKQPKFESGGEVSIRTGSFDLFKPAIDIYGPVSKNIAYRVNGTYEMTNSFRKEVSSKRYYINPSMLFKLGERTELLVQADYLKHDFTPDFGIGTLGNTIIPDVPRSRFMGVSWQYAHTQQTTSTVTLKHQLNNNWSLNGTISYQNYNRDYYSTERIQALADGKFRRPLGRTKTNEDYYIGQIDLTGKFKTGVFEHTLLAGVDADKYLTVNYAYDQPTMYDSINILDLNMYKQRTDIPAANITRRANTSTNRAGVYVQDLIRISKKFNLLAGIRWSYLENGAPDTFYFKTNTHIIGKGKYDQAFSPRFGLVYKPLPATAIFMSYSNSFLVNTGVGVDGVLNPSIIDQYELGVKNDFYEGLLSTNVTLYRIKNNNFTQTAAFKADGTQNSDPNLKAMIGETISDGIEVDIMGHPLPGLDIIAGYSYNNMRITKTPGTIGSNIKGERLVGTPDHTANASIFYTFATTKLKGLKIGASAYYTGQRFGGWNNVEPAKNTTPPPSRLISVAGFATADLTAGYTYNKISLLVKVSNITNTKSYLVHENYSVNPIAPTAFVATIAYRFK
ncbi:iron complex outermembrane recepter protein [Chitinophaga sp. CF118]|uniref:TonB-dependent siderophore receptor n=1 Tax=Chitinophaga sp. CF118 TaxID=1884367 RepID=UPI0008E8FF84|nr:TonB-dependent receptor [Chitinophaga sp. CF118]SFE84714.1 iron complex outermembrane recepter protein [Chitinophaga sp. CF118]